MCLHQSLKPHTEENFLPQFTLENTFSMVWCELFPHILTRINCFFLMQLPHQTINRPGDIQFQGGVICMNGGETMSRKCKKWQGVTEA